VGRGQHDELHSFVGLQNGKSKGCTKQIVIACYLRTILDETFWLFRMSGMMNNDKTESQHSVRKKRRSKRFFCKACRTKIHWYTLTCFYCGHPRFWIRGVAILYLLLFVLMASICIFLILRDRVDGCHITVDANSLGKKLK
jgi:hypothetical protein